VARFAPQPEGLGPIFPDFFVNGRSKMIDIRRSSFLELEKIGFQRRSWESS
jgi:hypothetical protein